MWLCCRCIHRGGYRVELDELAFLYKVRQGAVVHLRLPFCWCETEPSLCGSHWRASSLSKQQAHGKAGCQGETCYGRFVPPRHCSTAVPQPDVLDLTPSTAPLQSPDAAAAAAPGAEAGAPPAWKTHPLSHYTPTPMALHVGTTPSAAAAAVAPSPRAPVEVEAGMVLESDAEESAAEHGTCSRFCADISASANRPGFCAGFQKRFRADSEAKSFVAVPPVLSAEVRADRSLLRRSSHVHGLRRTAMHGSRSRCAVVSTASFRAWCVCSTTGPCSSNR